MFLVRGGDPTTIVQGGFRFFPIAHIRENTVVVVVVVPEQIRVRIFLSRGHLDILLLAVVVQESTLDFVGFAAVFAWKRLLLGADHFDTGR